MQDDFNLYGEESFSFTCIQNKTMKLKEIYPWKTRETVLRCGKPHRNETEMKKTEKEWMIRLKTYDPHFGYNYLDQNFINGPKNNKNKRAIVAERYDFPVELL